MAPWISPSCSSATSSPVLDINRTDSRPVVRDLAIRTVSDCREMTEGIAAAIAKNVPDATVLATDLSAEALEVAQRNFDALDLGETVSAREANLLDLSPDAAGGLFDVIVSNPPYVGAGDDLGWGVDREPAMALFAGDDGLDLIRTMVAQAPQHLRPGGLFAMEFGLGQADDIRDLLLATGQFAEPIFLRDHNDIERIVTTQKL